MTIKSGKLLFYMFAVLLLLQTSEAVAQVQGKVTGLVVDSEGNPLDRVTISIISVRTASQRYETRTGKDGKFAQIGIQPGYYQVIVKKEGYVSRTLEIHVEIASDTNLEIKLQTASELAIKNLSGADKAFIRATDLYNKQKYEEAVTGFLEAIRLDPDNWAYYFNLGLSYKKLNKLSEAREAFSQAAELNPESFSAHKEIGELLARDDQFEAAAKYYGRAVCLNPKDPDGHYNLGVCLMNLGQSQEALEHFKKTVELKPDYAEAYFQLGSLYISQNEKAEAIVSLERFIELSPQHDKAGLARQLLEYLRK